MPNEPLDITQRIILPAGTATDYLHRLLTQMAAHEPLDIAIRLVDEQGRPTDYFHRWLQGLGALGTGDTGIVVEPPEPPDPPVEPEPEPDPERDPHKCEPSYWHEDVQTMLASTAGHYGDWPAYGTEHNAVRTYLAGEPGVHAAAVERLQEPADGAAADFTVDGTYHGELTEGGYERLLEVGATYHQDAISGVWVLTDNRPSVPRRTHNFGGQGHYGEGSGMDVAAPTGGSTWPLHYIYGDDADIISTLRGLYRTPPTTLPPVRDIGAELTATWRSGGYHLGRINVCRDLEEQVLDDPFNLVDIPGTPVIRHHALFAVLRYGQEDDLAWTDGDALMWHPVVPSERDVIHWSNDIIAAWNDGEQMEWAELFDEFTLHFADDSGVAYNDGAILQWA